MINKFLIISLLLFFSTHSYSQEKSFFNFDIGLSQTYKGFFYLYDGIVEVGGGYNHKLVSHLFGGISFHIDYLSRNNSTARTIVYKPKFNLSYNFKVNSWLSINPIAIVGYSFVNISNNEFQYAETQKGINTGADLRLLINTQSQLEFYIFGRYDYIYLDEDVNFTQLEYYRRVHLSSFGLGIKIKSKDTRIKMQELR